MNNNLTPRRDLSPSAINTALRHIHAPDPNFIVRVTVDGKRVDVAEIQADGTGMCFYRNRPIIPVSVGVFKPDFGKFPFEKNVADIDFKSLIPKVLYETANRKRSNDQRT